MSTVDKATLLASRLGEDKHEIPGVGEVRIRGLSRAEVLELRNLDVAASDRRMVSLALVEPTLTESDVEAWQKSSRAYEIEGLTGAIANLSGQGAGASKSGVPGA